MKAKLKEFMKSGRVELPNGGMLTRDGKDVLFEASQKFKIPVKLDDVQEIASGPPMVVLLESLMGLDYTQLVKKVGRLTRREREVFMKMGMGAKNRQIAVDLGISTRTLDIHRANIGKKLGLKHANAFGRAYWFYRLCNEFSPVQSEKS